MIPGVNIESLGKSLCSAQQELCPRPQTLEEKLMRINFMLHELKTHGLEASFGLMNLGDLRAALLCQEIHDKAFQALEVLEAKHPFLR
jgi:hypothetical protein